MPIPYQLQANMMLSTGKSGEGQAPRGQSSLGFASKEKRCCGSQETPTVCLTGGLVGGPDFHWSLGRKHSTGQSGMGSSRGPRGGREARGPGGSAPFLGLLPQNQSSCSRDRRKSVPLTQGTLSRVHPREVGAALKWEQRPFPTPRTSRKMLGIRP